MAQGRHRVYSNTANHHFNRLVLKNGRKSFPTTTIPTTPSLPSSPAKKRNADHLQENGTQFEEGVPMDYAPPITIQATTNTSNDYMRTWKETKRNVYLHEHLARKAPHHHNRPCKKCGVECNWRCLDCLAWPAYCTECCRSSHILDPFHRIERWTGSHYAPSWLWKVGLVINLGHAGDRCPQGSIQANGRSGVDVDIIDEEEWYDSDDHPDGDSEQKPPDQVHNGGRVMTIIHTSGAHYLPVIFCGCAGSVDEDLQLLRMGLYPSTYKSCKTVFTTQVLDDYLLENLECKTSAHSYYSKIKRVTNYTFPQATPDRYRELMRVGRQYRNLTELATFGFGHKTASSGDRRNVGFFCSTCPQPGVNLPENWNEDPTHPEMWKYTRGFVADGNFTAAHQKQPRPEDDVWLKNGESFMTKRRPYLNHIKEAIEDHDPKTCHEHDAVNNKNVFHRGFDVTGIGAIACLRHGNFCPGSVVDFQKGERQMNMDYALCQALKNTMTEEENRVIFVYDINCQYMVNLQTRLKRGAKYLWIRPDLVFIPGIGLFHVHGHQDICFPRFAPTFIPGAGQTDGEILETLWAVLNEVGRTTRTMTLAHRSEVLDSHMMDNNWKKMINMVGSLCKKWKRAKEGLAQSSEALKELSSSASEEQITTWTEQMKKANADRASDISAMDIYYVQVKEAETQKAIQLRLMKKEEVGEVKIGLTGWVNSGIKIQEAQAELAAFVRAQGINPGPEQKLEIMLKRRKLSARLEEFSEAAKGYFPHMEPKEGTIHDAPLSEEIVDDDDWSDCESDEDITSLTTIPVVQDQNYRSAENEQILLPSSFRYALLPPPLADARSVEIQLRIAQANSALKNLREAVGYKSFLYRKRVRPEKSKKPQTRAYAAIHASDKEMKTALRVYNQARWALIQLGAPRGTLDRYRPIRKKDTRALTSVYDGNAPGQRNKSLPWFWSMTVEEDCSGSSYMEQLYRVSWLRAKARHERWSEEHALIPNEMNWTRLFFLNKAKEWGALKELVMDKPGHVCFAEEKVNMWQQMAFRATKAFVEAGVMCEDILCN